MNVYAVTIIILALGLIVSGAGRVQEIRTRKRLEERRRVYDESQQKLIASSEGLCAALNKELTTKNKLIEVLTETHGLYEQRIEHQLSTINALRDQFNRLESAYKLQGQAVIDMGDAVKERTRDNIQLRNQLAGYRQKLGEKA